MEAGGEGLTVFALLLPFVTAALAPVLVSKLGHSAALVLAIAPLAIFVHLLGFLDMVAGGVVVIGGVDWVPSLGVDFSWRFDGLSLTFGLLISGIGALIVLYAGGYMKGHPQQGRFVAFILLFMGAMLGLVASDSFLMLFVFWELTSITSFLLIGFDHTREASRRAAIQALVVTGMGGLSLLAGLLVMGIATGAGSMTELLTSGDAMRGSAFYGAALVLVLGGAFTKSAQFPFHFWLPNAMEAPTPVSAYLHSATMVKAGVYLLMRLNPVLGDTVAWETILPLFGGTTLLVGGVLAIRQTDLKLMLAYTTVASLGLLVMLTGFGSAIAIEAAVLYLVAHALFKGALFMVAGIVDHETGTRDVRALGGLRRAMPVTSAAAALAAVSMAGLPPAFGFMAKEEIYAALSPAGAWTALLLIVAIIGNALMFAIACAVALRPFLGAERETPKHAHEGPILLWLGPLMLAVLGIAAALFAGMMHEVISSPMASAVAGAPMSIGITLVPHIGLPLLLSAITIVLGVVIYRSLDGLRDRVGAMLSVIGWGPDRGFDQAIRGLLRLAHGVTAIIQNGRLDIYMSVIFAAVALALLVPMWAFDEWPAWPGMPDLRFYEWTIIAIALIGLFAILIAHDRLRAIVSLGIQGFAVAVLYMLLGAPDLSFTQFMVETLSVVVLALAMTRLKLTRDDHRPLREILPDAVIAAACGLGVALYMLRVSQSAFDRTLTDFFNAYSYVIAHGRNVVNVIIVDFRGLDTLGEIAVVMITGLAILALVRIRVRTATEAG